MILKFHRRRILAFFAIVLVSYVLLLLRMYSVQVMQQDSWRTRMESTQARTLKVWRKRGTIFDSAGNPLAFSYTTWSLIADPVLVEDPAGTARKISEVLGWSDEARVALEKKLSTTRRFEYIQRKLEPPVADRIRALKLKGLTFEREFKRFYPNPSLASNVLGIVGLDNKGLAGLEHSYDDQLSGLAGETIHFSGLRGLEIPRSQLVVRRPRGGHHIYLTLDSGIQQIAEFAVEKLVADHAPRNCFVLIVDPMTGKVKACAVRPTFDQSSFQNFALDINKARNLAISHIFEPGSTIKIVTVAAALEEEKVTPSTPFHCPGYLSLWGFRIGCTSTHGHLTTTEVLVRSCNVGAMSMGIVLGPRALYYFARKFGFGERSGIELPGEAEGILRPPRDWSGLSVGAIAMGQEIGVTGLQMAMAASAIVNGGKLLKPTIIEKVTTHDNRKVLYRARPVVRHQVMSPETAGEVKKMMGAVVMRGTGRRASSDLYLAGGKTGTSQKLGGRSRGAGERDIVTEKVVTSFVGFFPYEEPRYLIYVMANEPQSYRPMGGKVAAPVFRDLATQIMWYENLVPNAVRDSAPPAAAAEKVVSEGPSPELPEWANHLEADVARSETAPAAVEAGEVSYPMRGVEDASEASAFDLPTDSGFLEMEYSPLSQ